MHKGYEVNSWDVCVQGFQRLRSQSEFILVAYVEPNTRPKDIKEQLLDDLRCCERCDDFNHEEAEKAVAAFIRDEIRPLFKGGKKNPLDLEKRPRDVSPDDWEPCRMFVYIEPIE